MAIAEQGSRKLRPIGFRFVSGRGVAVLLVVLAGLDMPAAPLAAQPFGWLFGAPSAYRGARPRRRAATPAVEVPLPVPRPHFPGDPPTDPPAATPPPSPASSPLATAPAEQSDVPMPPEKPAEIARPGRDEPAEVAPAAPREHIPKAEPPDVSESVSTKPVPAKSAPSKPEPATPAAPAPTTAAPPPKSEKFGPPPAPPPGAPLPPERPPELKKPGGAGASTPMPTVAPSGARLGEAPGQPVEDAGCPARLKARDVEVEPIDIGPQPDPRCTVVQPVRLIGLALADGTKVTFPEKPRIACTTADAFSAYIRDLLAPLAKGTYGSTVTSVWTGPGLECRSRDHIFGAKLSAHGQGLAVDVAQLKLADGRIFEVGQPKAPADQSFETASRAGACGYFHTVLGPGSDSYHRTHWHFDLEVRGAKGDTKYCH